MKRLFLGIASTVWISLLAAQPEAVGVYTFSRDSIGGLDDELLDAFRRELGKYSGSVMEIAYTREEALVTVQFLGQGTLAVELDSAGDAVRHLWTPDEKAPKMWAVLRMGSYSREFSVEGSGGRDISRLAKAIGDWLQRNQTAIRGARHPDPPGG